jgi:transcriptional activator for dhaKLM operon
MLGNPVQRALQLLPPFDHVIVEQREISDVEITLQVTDRFVKCVITIRTIRTRTGGVIGGIAMLRTLTQFRSLVNQHAGALATMTFADFHSASSPMQHTIRQAKIAAKGWLPVLLSGEGGAGKTALAQAIHNASPRAGKPLVIVNCSMIPNEFIMQELLGQDPHGSEAGRPSKFELADGGTLLFDQIDQLSLQGQEILLRVMNSRTVTRLHALRSTTLNIRVIATTSRSIEQLVETRSFLPQLYYQFQMFHLYLPPLRQRHEDVAMLTRHFLERAPGYRIDDDVIAVLQHYPWPGNVRELESVIERAVIHAAQHTIRITDLPEVVQYKHTLRPESALPQPVISLVDAERNAILCAGWAYRGGISNMAAALGISRSTLWRKFKEHGIAADDFKITRKSAML